MYPFLFPGIFENYIPLYDLLIIVGVLCMIGYVTWRFEKQDNFTRKQTNKLMIILLVSLVVALFSSYLFDGIFHSIKEGRLAFGSITFLGGLIGGVVCFMVLLKIYYKDENKDVKKIMNTILTGVVLAHAIGRIGCFLAGCCYGIPTESFLGVDFPHGHAHIAYPDVSILPTQLFEAFFLFALFIIMNKVQLLKKFEVEAYLFGYGFFRIFLELIRGDDRGSFLPFFETQYNIFPTPSQYISLLMVVAAVVMVIRQKRNVPNTI